MNKKTTVSFMAVVLLFGVMLMAAPKAHAEANVLLPLSSYSWAEASWAWIPNAEKIHVFYKEASSSVWQHAVRDLRGTSTGVKISYLKKGVVYTWQALVKKTDNSWMWLPQMTLHSMPM